MPANPSLTPSRWSLTLQHHLHFKQGSSMQTKLQQDMDDPELHARMLQQLHDVLFAYKHEYQHTRNAAQLMGSCHWLRVVLIQMACICCIHMLHAYMLHVCLVCWLTLRV